MAEDPKSIEIIKPFLAGKDVKRYQNPVSNKYLIIAKRGILIENYPAVFNHLKQFESILRKKAGGGAWYELQASPSDSNKFEVTKIMYPDISKDMNFILDEHSNYSVNTVYNIGSSSKALLSYLNSKLFHFYYQTISNSIRGGYLRFFTDYMSVCPVPKDISSLEDLSNQILQIKKQNPTADTTVLESQIDQLVYQLYELTPGEIAIIEESVK